MIDKTTPAPVTIGVPVFNGAAFLAESLETLRRQTFTDFQVMIFDNASDDATAEIAAAFVAKDSRFHYHRNSANIRAVPNFNAVLQATETPYFLWRAADDVSDLNYIEVLHGLLEANPDKDLAVGRIVSMFDGAEVREYRLPDVHGRGLRDQYRMLFEAHPSWIYGLFRTAALKPIVARVYDSFVEDAQSWDNLSLMPFLLDFRIIGTDATTFRQALRSGLVKFGDKRPPLVEMDFDRRLQHRARFARIGREFISEHYPPGPRRWAGLWMFWLYTNKNAYKFKHIVRRTLRRLVGLRA